MPKRRLRIVHCVRSPVGGAFRHVRNLVAAQAAKGHEVAIVLDSLTGSAFEERILAETAPFAALGIHRMPMRRAIAPSDLICFWRIFRLLARLKPDILHGHGAKGGAYARLCGMLLRPFGQRAARLYTPHGGSLHYDPKTAGGRLLLLLERLLERLTDHLLFVSQYEADAYRMKVRHPAVPWRVIHNGLERSDFGPVPMAPDAADFLYVGMLRGMKGPDLFIEALACLAKETGAAPTALIVGDGEDREALMRLAERRLPGRIGFLDPMPARAAFALAKVVVVPSRFESLPYIVLEAIAAQRPIVAANVGGIGEIIPPELQSLVPPNDAAALGTAMAKRLSTADRSDARLHARVRKLFSAHRMADATTAAYWRALERSRPRKSSTLETIETDRSNES